MSSSRIGLPPGGSGLPSRLATASLRLSRVRPSSATTMSRVCMAAEVGDYAVEGHAEESYRAPGNTLRPMGVDTKAKAAVKKPAVHPNTWVFYEGEFARYNDVRLGLMTHALHYGTAVFEGIRAYWN